ncbi:mitotic spindle density 5 [Haematobia irritans]|uniref:mitotic spindle density 5 n=1 Tax=Haematobia irritans TaxID=7368 RepID=UPI003F500041
MCDFDKIESAMADKYVDGIKSTLETMNITEHKDFYIAYQKEDQLSGEESSATKTPPNLEVFAEVFKLLDVYPTNVPKPKQKTTPVLKDRMNSTISKSAASSLNDLCSNSSNSSIHQKESSNSSMNFSNKFEDFTAKPSDTYKNFLKFQMQLKQITSELADRRIEKEYEGKLKQLYNFSQQLEKLLPREKVGHSALTPHEDSALAQLVNKVDDLCFLKDNQGIFCQKNNPIYNNTQRLDELIDILTHCLVAVNSFNLN